MKKVTPENPYTETYDLNNCDLEPLHVIQTVQSFATVIAVDTATWTIRQASSNAVHFLNMQVEDILEHSLYDIFPEYVVNTLKKGFEMSDFSEINPLPLPISEQSLENQIVIAHIVDQQLILEIEKVLDRSNEFALLNKTELAIKKIQACSIAENLFQVVTTEVKNITGYDRVMIYKFDDDYNGVVVGEALENHLEPFLGLRYPATDIPKQARQLFLDNRVRMLSNTYDELAFIQPSLHPVSNQPLNVGGCASRGVSPIHLEYLRNMGVQASLSVAIVEAEKLWGLIACHHTSRSKFLDYRTRSIIKFIGQIISGHLSLYRANEFRSNLIIRNKVHGKLFEQMNKQQNVVKGLLEKEVTLLNYIESDGAAIVFEDKIEVIGNTPTNKEISALRNLLEKKSDTILFSTNNLKDEFQNDPPISPDFGGILTAKISERPAEYIMWFRYAETREVLWGGNPNKSVNQKEKDIRLSPRKSFEKWKQIVENQSKPWKKNERDAVVNLRNDIKEIILKRFNELKKLHQDLQTSYDELESFSYSVSHDLRSPLRAIEGFSQILLEDYVDKLDDYGISVINTIISSIHKMNLFVDDLLILSKLVKVDIIYNDIDVNNLIPNLIAEHKMSNSDYQKVIVETSDLPKISGDQTMIRQLFQNLIGNALKYSYKKPDPKVYIEGRIENEHVIYQIRDNGIGMYEKYIPKIFDVFSRLVSDDEYEGTGVGLSIVKRIIDRHNGEVLVESKLGEGTTFWVKLPLLAKDKYLN